MFNKNVATIYELVVQQNHPYPNLFKADRTENISLYFQTYEQAVYYRDKFYLNRTSEFKSHLAYDNDGQWALLKERHQACPVAKPEKLRKNNNYLTFPAGWILPKEHYCPNQFDVIPYQELIFSRDSYQQLMHCPENSVVGVVFTKTYRTSTEVEYDRGDYQKYCVETSLANSAADAASYIYKDSEGQYSLIKSANKSVKLVPAAECTPPHDQVKSVPVAPVIAAPVEFSPPTDAEKSQAVKLYHLVHKADYRNIELMWKRNPRLMFIEVEFESGAKTTPLKHAFYHLDKWTWKPFYEWIQKSRPELVHEFLKQNAEQTKHIDLDYLQPLFNEYQIYLNMKRDCGRAFAGYDEFPSVAKSQSHTAIDHEWPKLARMQRKYLPWCVVRELCRPGQLWLGNSLGPDARFDHNTPPVDGSIATVSGEQKLDSEKFERSFGDGHYHGAFIGLVRSWHLGAGSGLFWTLGDGQAFLAGGDVKHDPEIIKQLIKVRTADLACIPAPARTLVQEEEQRTALRM